MEKIDLYTDGACLSNPGPGGYCAIINRTSGEEIISGGFQLTTNNRMELIAVIKGLSQIKEKSDITIYSDSRYLVDAMTLGWVERWKANSWKRSPKEKAQNVDLWVELLSLCNKHNVKFVWLAGHKGHRFNERCDYLARQAAHAGKLSVDSGYSRR